MYLSNIPSAFNYKWGMLLSHVSIIEFLSILSLSAPVKRLFSVARKVFTPSDMQIENDINNLSSLDEQLEMVLKYCFRSATSLL